MSAPEVKLVSVRCFEAFDKSGTSLGLFKVESEWKGFSCLRSIDSGRSGSPGAGLELIVRKPATNIFAEIFGEHRVEARAVAASAELAAKLNLDGGSRE